MLQALRRRRGLATTVATRASLPLAAAERRLQPHTEEPTGNALIGQARVVSGASGPGPPAAGGDLLPLVWAETRGRATAGARWGPEPWQRSRRADAERAEAWRRDPRRLELLKQLIALKLSKDAGPQVATAVQELGRETEHRNELKQAARRGDAEEVLRIARGESSLRPAVAAEALAACVRHVADPSTAQSIVQTGAKEGLLPPKSAAKAMATILDRVMRKEGPRQVILAASKLLGRDPSCVASGQAQPCNHSLRVVAMACGHLGDRALVNTVWADLSTCLVTSSMPSAGAYAGLLHAAVTYDRLHAQRAGTSQVAEVLSPHSFTSEVLERVRAVPYISVARIPTDQVVALTRACSTAAEIDKLLFSPHVSGMRDGDEIHDEPDWFPTPGDASAASWGGQSLETGWLPPPLSPPVACAAIRAFVRVGHPGPAWHVLWKCLHMPYRCTEVWEAMASSCAEAGNVIGATRSIQLACTHGVTPSQETLLRVLRCIASSEPVPGWPHPYQEARTLWRSGLIQRNPHADRLWLQCMAESGYDDGSMILTTLPLYAHRVGRERDPEKRQLNLERLAAAGAAACMRMRKAPWHLRLERLGQCLKVIKDEFPPSALSPAVSRAAVHAVLEAAPALGVMEREEVFRGLMQRLATAGVSLGEDTCKSLDSFLAEYLQGSALVTEVRQRALREALQEMEELTVLVRENDLVLEEALRSLGVASNPQ